MDRPKILVVDDEVLLTAYMEELLTDAGYDVTLANRGDLALSTFASGQFAGLVTDIRMPGIDGWSLANQVRDRYPDFAIVYVSGDSATEWTRRGVTGSVMIAKPFPGNRLVEALNGLLGTVVH